MSEKPSVHDRRAQRTRKALKEALLQLLTKKELGKVTVQEIADIADVNRVTFYKHYLDVYDLYDQTEKEFLIDMGLMVLRLQEVPKETFFKEFVKIILENKAVFGMVFSPNNTTALLEKFSHSIEGLILNMLSEQCESDVNDTALRYRACYHARGCLAVLGRWVNEGYTESEDEIVRIISDLFKSIDSFEREAPQKPAVRRGNNAR